MSEKNRYYNAPFSFIPCLSTLLIISFTWILLIVFLFFIRPPSFLGASIMFLIQPVFVFSYIISPKGYYILNDRIAIDKGFWKVEIPFVSVEEISYKKRWYGIGFITVGAHRLYPFGFWGNFWSSKIGRFEAYCRRWKRFVLITTTNGNKYVISPHKPKEFIRDLETAMENGRNSVRSESVKFKLISNNGVEISR